MLKKLFISAILLIAVLSFVVSLLKGNNNGAKVVSVPDRVAVINIEGPILSGDGKETLFNHTAGVTSGSVMRQIREAADDKSVKVLLLRIDSGGGSATAAEEIGRELKRFKENTNKPIVSAMGNMGASAAYWIAACASDKIYANSTTLTGSIGVYMPYMNVEELFKKIGITSGKIKSGPYKDIMSGDRPMTPEEQAILQEIVNEIYADFIKTVAEGRKMDEAKVRGLADGRIYTGEQAQKLGLVDELGNYYDALAAAGKLGGIEGEPPVKEPARQTPWEMLFTSEMAKAIEAHIIRQITGDVQLESTPKAER
ncbi:MAG: signal peptide peptidase SppA [Phascolarctobacterium sp.]|nr:signal peptide peptidase SppA [Phascolarctobacterium sp.]